MVKPIKKKAPSRTRYEQSHPTVSCRVSREIYDRLQAVKEADSKSFANILKVGLGLLEVQVKEKEKAKRKGHAGLNGSQTKGNADTDIGGGARWKN